jgi:spermidine/putrescine-binding protein
MRTITHRGRLAAVLAVTALLASACAGGDEAGTATACEAGRTDGDLLLYNWTDYVDPELIPAFEAEYGVEVVEDFYTSNEELLARISAGGSGYDVVVPSDYAVRIMVEEGDLLELQHDAIPNLANLRADFTDPAYDPGNTHSVPYLWGTTGLGVNVGLLGDVEPSWALVFDPDVAGNLPGRVSMLDDPREVLGAALHYLGLDPNTISKEDLQRAADLVAQAREWTAAYDSGTYQDLLISGEVVVAQGYSGNFLEVFDGLEGFAYLVPEEGATVWNDAMAVLADAPHPCTAHAFIDFVLRAERGAALTEYIYYPSPNAAAEALIDPEILADPAVYPSAATQERLQFLEDTGEFEARFTDLYVEATS